MMIRTTLLTWKT